MGVSRGSKRPFPWVVTYIRRQFNANKPDASVRGPVSKPRRESGSYRGHGFCCATRSGSVANLLRFDMRKRWVADRANRSSTAGAAIR